MKFSLPIEIVNHIWNYTDIDTKLVLNRVFGARVFYTTPKFIPDTTVHKRLIGLLRIQYFRYIVLKQITIIKSNAT